MYSGKTIKQIIIRIKRGGRLRDLAVRLKTDEHYLRTILLSHGCDYKKVLSKRRKRIADAEFKNCLDFAKQNKRMPTMKEFRMLGIPLSKTGLFSIKLFKMGFKRQKLRSNYIKNSDLLSELISISKKIKHLPENKDILEHSKYSTGTFNNHFGSIRNAHKLIKYKMKRNEPALGLEKYANDITERQRLKIEGLERKRAARKAAINEIKKRRVDMFLSGASIEQIADSEGLLKRYVREILRDEGVLYKEIKKRNAVERKLHFEKAVLFAQEFERIPNGKEMKNLGIPEKLQREIRLHLNKQGYKSYYPKQISTGELISELKRIHKIVNRTPTNNDIRKFGRVSYLTYYDRFGSISKAQATAGFIPNKRGAQKKVSSQ